MHQKIFTEKCENINLTYINLHKYFVINENIHILTFMCVRKDTGRKLHDVTMNKRRLN